MAQLAQLNLARLKAPKGDPLTDEFFRSIPPINALAESSPGFVWRLIGEVKDHTDIPFFVDPLMVVNISVWEDVETFRHFVYKSGHVQYIKRKKEWMESFAGPYSVLWWVPDGHQPTLAEAKQKFDALCENGPNPEAFDLQNVFPPV